MPIFITQGRYSHDAMRGMVARPEDRSQAVSRLIEGSGGKLLSYYVTFGEYDFLIISEGPDMQSVSAAVIAAAAGGGVTDLKTTVAMTSAEAVQAFQRAGDLAKSFRSAGQAG